MSYPIGAVVGATAGAAAARRAREEEQMAGYNAKDLDGWEFKIVRSALGRFSSRRAIERVQREEAQSGWELVEKFDDSRVRFKRRVEKRSGDGMATIDPYRTSVGIGGDAAAGVIAGIVALVLGLGLFLFFLTTRGGDFELPIPTIGIGIAVLVVLILVIVVALRRSRR